MQSYRLSRDLLDGEQLDFSTHVGDQKMRVRRRGKRDARVGPGMGIGSGTGLGERDLDIPKSCGLFYISAADKQTARCWELENDHVTCYRLWHRD